MKATEVFTPGKLPDVTYIETHLLARKGILIDSLEMGASVISLSGPSKSGKTVFVEKVIGKENLLQVTGAGVDTTKRLWDRVFDLIGTPVRTTKTVDAGSQLNLAAKASVGVNFLAKAEAEAGVANGWTRGESTAVESTPDYLQLLIKELAGTDFVIFIDDFHYITKDAQIAIANEMKEAIRSGVKFICASVPYHSDDVIRANADLRGRIVKIDFDYWAGPELKEIAVSGFDALNIELSDATLEGLVQESAGSPQLMQSLCLNLCFELGYRERQSEKVKVPSDLFLIEQTCRRTALMTDYSSTVEKMKDGPKTRGQDRKSHQLHDDTIIDVYPIILKAIAQNPPELTIRYANLLSRIAALCKQDTPSGSSVTGACFHMSQIANDADNKVIVEWDSANDVLDIRDPYLLFYLRWADDN